jgi:hypothetical protein
MGIDGLLETRRSVYRHRQFDGHAVLVDTNRLAPDRRERGTISGQIQRYKRRPPLVSCRTSFRRRRRPRLFSQRSPPSPSF